VVAASDLKVRVCQAIDRNRGKVAELVEDVFQHPELGFKESRTQDVVCREFDRLGIAYQSGLALTGVKGTLGSACRRAVAILAEMDALPVGEGGVAAHLCGHHAQVGMLVGAAIGLSEAQVLEDLGGRVVFMAVPAEEQVDLESRLTLRDSGQIEFLSGKQELIRLGAFDDVDAVLSAHGGSGAQKQAFQMGVSTNGHITLIAEFLGRAAHAATPHLGANALKAASLSLAAIDAQRELYAEDGYVRINSILSSGGSALNIVPAEVRVQTSIRAASVEALQSASANVRRAFRAGGLGLQCALRMTTIPGYLPLIQSEPLTRVFRLNAEALVGPDQVGESRHTAATTDLGDVSQLLPTCHPECGGSRSTPHAVDFRVLDIDQGVLNPAKAMALSVIDLLENEGSLLDAVRTSFRPRFSKAGYLEWMRSLAQRQEFEFDDA
jgi:amidohydrolase